MLQDLDTHLVSWLTGAAILTTHGSWSPLGCPIDPQSWGELTQESDSRFNPQERVRSLSSTQHCLQEGKLVPTRDSQQSVSFSFPCFLQTWQTQKFSPRKLIPNDIKNTWSTVTELPNPDRVKKQSKGCLFSPQEISFVQSLELGNGHSALVFTPKRLNIKAVWKPFLGEATQGGYHCLIIKKKWMAEFTRLYFWMLKFWNWVFCLLGWPWTHCLPVSASWVPGLQTCADTVGFTS